MKSLFRVFLLGFFLLTIFAPANAMGQLFLFGHPLMGKAAPDFKLETLKGGEQTLAQLRDGKPAILFFWATWCPHCRVQLKELAARKSEIELRGIKVVLVDEGETVDTIRAYFQRNKIDFEVFLDKMGTAGEDYGIAGIPTFFLIDRSGTVRSVEHSIPQNYEEILSVGK